MNIYDDIVEMFGVKPGDNIWLSTDLLGLVFVLRKKNIQLDANELLDAFIRRVSVDGTIMIPTFSYEFSNNGYYDIKKTKGVTGELGNVALSRSDFKRTRHPMHSFAVYGKDQKLLTAMNNLNSFGTDSPFGYCVSHRVKQIIIGSDYIHAMTFVHYAETICDVPYRFVKHFYGTYVDEQGVEKEYTCDFQARYLEIEPTEVSNLIGAILEEKGISKCINYEGIENYVINLAESLTVICDDIINNQCRNIYNFNVPREQIFG